MIAWLACDMLCYKVKAKSGGLARPPAAKGGMAAVVAEGVRR